MTKILFTSVGCPGFDSVLRSSKLALPDAKFLGCDANNSAYGKHLIGDFFVVPKSDAKEFSQEILKIILENKIDLIVPLGDLELTPLAKEFKNFSLVQNLETLELTADKSKLYDALLEFDETRKYVPQYIRCLSDKDVKEFADRVGKICVKPARTSGSRGFFVIEDFNIKTHGQQKMKHAIVSLDGFLNSIKKCKTNDMLACEFLPGKEYSVDCFVSESAEIFIPRERVQITSGICTEAHVVENRELIQASRAIAKKIGLNKNFNIQFRYDENQNPKLLEVNPRISGTIEACHGAGVNLVALGIFSSLPEYEKNFLEENKVPIWGTRMKRVYREIFWKEAE